MPKTKANWKCVHDLVVIKPDLIIFLLPSQARKCMTGLAVWEISESRLGIPDQPRKEFSVSTAGGGYSRVNDDRLLMKKECLIEKKEWIRMCENFVGVATTVWIVTFLCQGKPSYSISIRLDTSKYKSRTYYLPSLLSVNFEPVLMANLCLFQI